MLKRFTNRLVAALMVLVMFSASLSASRLKNILSARDMDDRFNGFNAYAKENPRALFFDAHELLDAGLQWDQIGTLKNLLCTLEDEAEASVVSVGLKKEFGKLACGLVLFYEIYYDSWKAFYEIMLEGKLSEDRFIWCIRSGTDQLPGTETLLQEQKNWFLNAKWFDGSTFFQCWEQR